MDADGEGSAVGDEARRMRRDLQGARGIGVTLVVVGHLFLWPAGVFAALDIFFVLSGYLITGILLGSLGQHGARFFGVFYLSRARRLVPMAALVLLVTVVGTYVVYSGARGHLVAVDAVWAFFFLVNWHFIAQGQDYFAIHTASPLQHYWSLSVEEQFYLVWPLLVLVALRVARRRRALLGVVLGAVTVVSFGYSLWHSHADPGAAYFSTLDRAWEFGVGGLVALAAPRLVGLAQGLKDVLSWVGTLGVLGVIFVLQPGVAFPAPLGLLPVALTVAIIVGGIGSEPRHQYLLSNPVSVYVGNISYSVYLWHFPVTVLLAPVLGLDTITFYAGALLATAVLSVASYHLVERPLRNARFLMLPVERRRRPPRPFLDPGTTAFVRQWGMLTVFALVLGTIYTGITYSRGGLSGGGTAVADAAPITGVAAQQARLEAALDATGFPAFSPSLDQLAQATFESEHLAASCVDVDLADLASCRYGPADADAAHTVLVTGDSFAISWMPTVLAAYLPRGWAVQQITATQCPSWRLSSYVQRDGTDFPQCAALHATVETYVARERPGVVILASSYDQVLNSTWAGFSANGATVAQQGLAAAMDSLAGPGTSFVVLQPPPPHKDLLECASNFGNPSQCTDSPSEYWYEHTEGESAAVADRDDATYVDTQAWFCVDGRCPGFVGTTPVTVDGIHLTVDFAEQLGGLLADALGLSAAGPSPTADATASS